jgi:hypothetical protein
VEGVYEIADEDDIYPEKSSRCGCWRWKGDKVEVEPGGGNVWNPKKKASAEGYV